MINPGTTLIRYFKEKNESFNAQYNNKRLIIMQYSKTNLNPNKNLKQWEADDKGKQNKQILYEKLYFFNIELLKKNNHSGKWL